MRPVVSGSLSRFTGFIWARKWTLIFTALSLVIALAIMLFTIAGGKIEFNGFTERYSLGFVILRVFIYAVLATWMCHDLKRKAGFSSKRLLIRIAIFFIVFELLIVQNPFLLVSDLIGAPGLAS